MQPRGCSRPVPPGRLPAEGRRRASEPHANSKAEKRQMLGAPLFTWQSLLYLQPPHLPGPPTSLPSLALIPRCVNQKVHTDPVTHEKKKQLQLARCFLLLQRPRPVRVEMNTRWLHLPAPGPPCSRCLVTVAAEGRQVWGVRSPPVWAQICTPSCRNQKVNGLNRVPEQAPHRGPSCDRCVVSAS